MKIRKENKRIVSNRHNTFKIELFDRMIVSIKCPKCLSTWEKIAVGELMEHKWQVNSKTVHLPENTINIDDVDVDDDGNIIQMCEACVQESHNEENFVEEENDEEEEEIEGRFLNISNHPSFNWSDDQLNEAKKFSCKIIDMKFPNIPAEASMLEVSEMAKAKSLGIKQNDVVHLMGEQSFCFILASILINKGIKVVVSCTERIVQEKDGEKISKFEFKQFRCLNSN